MQKHEKIQIKGKIGEKKYETSFELTTLHIFYKVFMNRIGEYYYNEELNMERVLKRYSFNNLFYV